MLKIKEKIILHQIQKGDEHAFGELYDRYKDEIYRFVYFKVSSEEKAHDLVNESFLKIYDYIKKDKEVRNFRAFLYKIARNMVIDFYRTRKDNISLDDTYELESDIDIEHETDNKVRLKRIKDYLKQINPKYREAVHLHYFEEFSFKEISEMVGESETNIRMRALRGIKKLKKLL